jgi:hypothetical protein
MIEVLDTTVAYEAGRHAITVLENWYRHAYD